MFNLIPGLEWYSHCWLRDCVFSLIPHDLLSLGLTERLEDGLFGQSLLFITMQYLIQSLILSSISLSI